MDGCVSRPRASRTSRIARCRWSRSATRRRWHGWIRASGASWCIAAPFRSPAQPARQPTRRRPLLGSPFALWRADESRIVPVIFTPMVDVVALAAELLAFESSTGSEGQAVEFVSRWLLARGWNVELQEVSKGRANVWATRKGNGVTLSTHLDTVLPYIAPREDNGRLYGRGSSDAKGIAAAMLAARSGERGV